MKIAEGLLLRKQIVLKVEQLKALKGYGEKGLFEFRTERTRVNDNIDEVKFQIPKVSMTQVTEEFDYWCSELRKLDAAIQRANWETDLAYTQAPTPDQKNEAKK